MVHQKRNPVPESPQKMKADNLQKQSGDPYVLKKGHVGEIMRACKALKLPMISPWNRKKKAAK